MRTNLSEEDWRPLEATALPLNPTPTNTQRRAPYPVAPVFLFFLGLVATLSGCGATGAAPSPSPAPPPPPAVTVTVTPTSASIFLGQSQTFTAQVTGTNDTSVSWAAGGVTGGNSAFGTITSSGVYTAPQILPSPAIVTITATSLANSSSSGSASVTIVSNIQVSISPPSATVAVGASQVFTATIAGTGNPSTSVTWSLSGPACSAGNCGSIATTGDTAQYTAPTTLPSSPTVTLSATSVADPSKSAAATITLATSCSPAISISPSAATVELSLQQTFTATVCISPNQAATWAIIGSQCTGTACGTLSSTSGPSVVYTAPSSLPPSNPVTLTATSQVDTTKTASATITVTSNLALTLFPTFAQVATNRRQRLSPTVTGTSSQAVTWTVAGIANGNSSVGQICQAGSQPCEPPAGPAAGSVDYLAPGTIPAGNPVVIRATSAADSSRSAIAEVGVIAHLSVRVGPAAAFIAPTGDAEFTAIVEGSSNQAVTWSVSCAATSCGTVTSAGVFTAPAQAPSPNAITVTATSQDDSTQSGSASVAIATAATIESLAPSSVTAGEADPFTLILSGLHFVASSPGPGSTLLVNGSARTTSCASALACSATINPGDVATTGQVTLQMKNPDGSLSNPVALVVAPAGGAPAVVSLSGSAPIAGGENLNVVEATTAGSGVPQATVTFVGLMDSTGTSCNVQTGTIPLARPSSGTATVTLCLFGSQMVPSDSFSFSAPSPTDVVVGTPQAFAGSLVQVPITISATTLAETRTLFVTDSDFNETTATAAIEVR